MAKAKKKARASARAEKPAAPIPTQTPGRKFATLRQITLPELVCKIEVPIYVTVAEKIREDIGADALEARARVTDLDTGETKDLVLGATLAGILDKGYPAQEYVGKSFCIVRHAKHARKNDYGFTVEEIDPAQKIEPAGDPA